MTGPVSDKYMREVCKIGKRQDCCRYLGADKTGVICLMGTPFQKIVDERVHKMTAQAVNCEGWEKVCE